jgi:opacity protein-like surface antigen
MIQTKALLTGMATAVVLSAAAHAADPPGSWIPGPYSYERPVPRYVEMVSGWYVRGDFGYRFNHIGSVEAPNVVTSSRYSDSLGLTFGGGYKYQWFRADVTVDYAPRVSARATSTLASAPQPQYTTKLEALSVLANFYLDLGTWAGFTPYVGVGAGASYLRGINYTDTTLASNNATANDRANFSWAAMAGVAYQVSPRWMIDLGFRHLELGDIPTTTGTGLSTDFARWKRLSTDEVRLGVRFLLD